MDDNSDIQFLSIIKILQRMNVLIPQYIAENIEVLIKNHMYSQVYLKKKITRTNAPF